MYSTYFYLEVGDVFVFVDEPDKSYKVAGIDKYKSGGAGMGEYPGGIKIFCTTGHYISVDAWTPIKRVIRVIEHDPDFKTYILVN